MTFIKRKTLLLLTGLLLLAVFAFGGFVWSGVYNIGADDAHTGPVYATLEALRDRSIAVRASKLEVPDLDDPARVTQGAGNYAAMCVGCHLAPGMTGTELSLGLYPAPPDLTRETVDAAQAFWVIKHGIKASGMPAWGKSMDDAYIWNMVAFLQQLPGMEAAQYQTLVASSGGHSHGGGETQPHPHPEAAGDAAGAAMPAGHDHPPGTPADHHDAPEEAADPRTPTADRAAVEPAAAPQPEPAEPAMVEHGHADGTVESHPVAPTAPTEPIEPTEPADDGHDHQH